MNTAMLPPEIHRFLWVSAAATLAELAILTYMFKMTSAMAATPNI
jgi:hypothetical protein